MTQPQPHPHTPPKHTHTRLIICCALLLCFAAAAACTKVVYVVQNPDGSFVEVTPKDRPNPDPQEVIEVAHTGDALVIDMLSSNDHILIGDSGPLFIQVTLEAQDGLVVDRAPYNLSIVIDRSGSMSGEKFLAAQAAADWLVDQLADGDRVSLVSYSSDVRLDVPSAEISDAHRAHLHQAIASLYSGGGTFLSGGMETGAAEVLHHLDRERLNRVVLLSDGNANEGVTDTYTLTRRADILREQGVTMTTMGVGYDYNEDLMMAVATYGGGNYYFVERATSMAQVFGEELKMLGNTVVRDAIVELELPPGVQVQDVYGFPYEQQGQHLKVQMSGVSSGERRRLLMALNLPPQSQPGEVEVATGRVRFRNELSKADEVVAFKPLKVSYTADQQQVVASLNTPVVEKVEAVRNAMARQEAMKQLDQGNAAAAQQVIQQRVAQSQQLNSSLNSGAISQGIDSMQSLQKKAAAPPAPASTDYKRMRKAETQDALMELTH